MPQPSYPKSTTAYAASLVVKGGPGVLLSLFGFNSGPGQFVQIHDKASLAATPDASVPLHTFAIAGGDNFSVIIPSTGLPCGVGIVVCNSTTGPTKTIGAADCWFTTTIQA